MDEKFLQKSKKRLEKEKIIIEEELKKFAEKDKKHSGDWDSRFPHWDGEAGGSALETAADEVEEYETRLPIEFSLETKLKNINLALEKINPSAKLRVDAEQSRSIKTGGYGKCEKCRGEIDKKRLKICPEARFCLKCKK